MRKGIKTLNIEFRGESVRIWTTLGILDENECPEQNFRVEVLDSDDVGFYQYMPTHPDKGLLVMESPTVSEEYKAFIIGLDDSRMPYIKSVKIKGITD